jgi:peroxiredoxin
LQPAHSLVGTTAPDFTLPDQDGQPVSLAQTLTRSRVVLIFYVLDNTLG